MLQSWNKMKTKNALILHVLSAIRLASILTTDAIYLLITSFFGFVKYFFKTVDK